MNPTIHIQILTGPDAGLQKALTESRIAFGRAPENMICVADPNASRQHGELLFHEGHWYILNRSPNGTTLNGKRIKGDQPIALKPGDVVGVAKSKLLSVHFTPAAATGPVEVAPPTVRRKLSGRAKLWIGIGVYLLLMLAIAILLTTGKKKESIASVSPLTDQQIEQEIRQALTVPFKDDRKAESELSEANQLFNRRTIKPSSLYETHRHYKLALAHSGKRSFDGLDQIQFAQVEEELIERTVKIYRDAYNKVTSGQWKSAEKTLRELLAQYPDDSSEIVKNVGAQLDIVLASAPKKRSF